MNAPRVYAIADLATLGEPLETTLPEAVTAMAAAGVRWIQLRAKPRSPAGPALSDRRLYALLESALEALEGGGVDGGRTELWINDRVDLAALFATVALPVAGVHLGQTDLPPVAARRVVGDAVRIGLSTHDEAQVEIAVADPDVDVVAVGPVFATQSKADPDPVVGTELLVRARQVVDAAARERGGVAKTLVAVGGIDARRLGAVLDAGADTAAFLSAACRRPVEESCRALVEAARAWEARNAAGGAPEGGA